MLTPLLHRLEGALGHSCARAALALSPVAAYILLRYLRRRFLTLLAVSPTPHIARALADFVSAYRLSEEEFYSADGAPEAVQEVRRAALDRLGASFDRKVGPKAREYNAELRGLSDVRFFDVNRVPHAFQPIVRSKLRLPLIVERAEGPRLVDVDGNSALDVSGSYGVNVAGYEAYM